MLCSAALGGEVKLMKMLAASIHRLTDVEKYHILILTCLYDRYRICAYLLELFPFLLARKIPLLDKHLLHIIVESGSIECFKVVVNLVTRDCQSDGDKQLSLKSLIDGNGSTILHGAFRSFNRNMIMYLLMEHPSLLTQKDESGYHGLSLMSLYCKEGHLTEKDIEGVVKRICHDDMIESLIDEDGSTILHWACHYVNEELCVKLSSTCPSLLLLSNDRGHHCLHMIASSGNIECFKSAVALVLEENEREQYITSLVNKAGKTVLHLACHSGQLDMCLYLIREYPALMSKKDHHGLHCLHCIAHYGNSEIFKSIASLVLEGKSKPEKKNFMKNLQTKTGGTVLHFACLDSKTDLCLYLIREYPQLLNQKDNKGHHCLHMIAHYGKVECFKAIAGIVLKGKSKTDMKQFMETLTVKTKLKTLLHHAAFTGKTEMCLYLIREYPKLFSQTNESGDHSLHYIAVSGNVECFKTIAPTVLKDKTKTECELFMEKLTNTDKETVLHHACRDGQTEMCSYLIKQYPKLMLQTDRYGNHCRHLTAQLNPPCSYVSIPDK
ncbi:serine/threonine-protein phosphatase 6 regulatory ankyrin repeat subunit C-like isoform X1 [Pecten maximus]|uniref:serine/threonine-protein phosphatase 6 regulatory ankyrin repeat subunit C-like isoform X1 n=1 Tax=Pecten maximus TaxID=6579 RepID=UPI001458C529|nr:serine/threonine-protein phosphatase 6 regulatory ankyrin repeat subunit C-like isoform X1 [Pecten maximus]